MGMFFIMASDRMVFNFGFCSVTTLEAPLSFEDKARFYTLEVIVLRKIQKTETKN